MLYIPSYFTSVSDVPLFTDNNKSFCFNRIEHAARTCYKSEIKEGDYTSSFLNRIYESRHLSVFEHSNFVIRTKTRIPDVILNYTLDNINRELRLNNEHGTSHVKYAVDGDLERDDDEEHTHFACVKCGRTFCMKQVHVPEVPLPPGFQLQSVNYVLKGLCPECAEK